MAGARDLSEDQFAHTVREHFEEFLQQFSSELSGGVSSIGSTDPDAAGRDYIEQCKVMKNDDRTTLFVDYTHVEHHNSDLAKAIAEDFYYLEPFLRKALAHVARQEHPGYYTEDKEFFVSFFNMSSLLCVRDLKSDKVAKLVSFSGTVTRTSEVRKTKSRCTNHAALMILPIPHAPMLRIIPMCLPMCHTLTHATRLSP